MPRAAKQRSRNATTATGLISTRHHPPEILDLTPPGVLSGRRQSFKSAPETITRYFTRLAIAIVAPSIKPPRYTLSRVVDAFSKFWTEIRRLSSVRSLQVTLSSSFADELTIETASIFNKLYDQVVLAVLETTGGVLDSLEVQTSSPDVVDHSAALVDAVPISISSLRTNCLKEFRYKHECYVMGGSTDGGCSVCSTIGAQIKAFLLNQAALELLNICHSCSGSPVTFQHIFPSSMKDCQLQTLSLINPMKYESEGNTGAPPIHFPTPNRLRHLTTIGYPISNQRFWAAMTNGAVTLESLNTSVYHSTLTTLITLPRLKKLRISDWATDYAGDDLMFSQHVLGHHAPTLRELIFPWYREHDSHRYISPNYIQQFWPCPSSFAQLEYLAFEDRFLLWPSQETKLTAKNLQKYIDVFSEFPRLKMLSIKWPTVVTWSPAKLLKDADDPDALDLVKEFEDGDVYSPRPLRSRTGFPLCIKLWYSKIWEHHLAEVSEELQVSELRGVAGKKNSRRCAAPVWSYNVQERSVKLIR
ncbi:hypothetical protein AX16_008955 [Volvariella volvacea WC 439]|nr:hypothetical protein AX16_008955 [Volvariella volvacea WC 439]